MPNLSPAQSRVVGHPGGPLLVVAGPGTGKTTVLVERFARLVADGAGGAGAESILALVAAPAAARRLRALLEDAIDGAYEELAVHTVHDLCARILHDEALEAGLDPFVVPLGRADRLAMLLEHLDDLPLREHDLGGSPAALMSRVVARIDRLKEDRVDAERFAAWAEEADRPREREFAQLYLAHERLLVEAGALDAGDLVLRALRLLRDRPHVRARVGARHRHVLVDDLQDLSPAALLVVEELGRGTAGGAGTEGNVCAFADDDQALPRGAGTAGRNTTAFRRSHPDAPVVRLERSFRCPERVLTGARAVIDEIPDRQPRAIESDAPDPGEVRFWQCANERAQAQGVARHVERLVRAGTPPEQIAVLVRSVRGEGRSIGLALEERALPYRLIGVDAFFGAPEVRDVLAWLRLLADPSDAAAVVRALSRPPIELGSVDLARCVQIARRRRLDMVAALVAANESPQIPPESRERILRFLKLLRAAASGLDTMRPDLFVHRLIDRLGLRRQQLFTAQADVVERLVMLSRLAEMAAAYVRRAPQATPREFARYAAAVADAGLGDDEPGTPGGAGSGSSVSVLTMAGAATLEADHVVLCGMESARMPGVRRAEAATGIDAPATPEAHVADMRRLTYLAMTRARRSLTISYAELSDHDTARTPSPFAEEARTALGAEWEPLEEELFGPEETLHATFQALRDELLGDVQRTARGLSELRFDTDLDVTHAVARYLEILKVAALLERPAGQSVADALPGINQHLLSAVSPLQREVLVELDARRRPRRRRTRRPRTQRRGGREVRAVPGGRSCRGAARGSRSRRGTSRRTGCARCATSSRACCGSRRSRRCTSGSASSSTRSSSATTRPAAARRTSSSGSCRPAGGAAASATARRSASCA